MQSLLLERFCSRVSVLRPRPLFAHSGNSFVIYVYWLFRVIERDSTRWQATYHGPLCDPRLLSSITLLCPTLKVIPGNRLGGGLVLDFAQPRSGSWNSRRGSAKFCPCLWHGQLPPGTVHPFFSDGAHARTLLRRESTWRARHAHSAGAYMQPCSSRARLLPQQTRIPSTSERLAVSGLPR